MDNSGDLMQKKLRIASNVSGYKKALDEANVLRQDNYLTQENFQRFEQGQTGSTRKEKERAAMFRSQLKEAMMWDEANANALGSEEAYKDILEEAKAEKAKLTDDANRTGASKVFHDITGLKRKRAKDKLKRMETAKEMQPIIALKEQMALENAKFVANVEADVQKVMDRAKNFLIANEPGTDTDNLTFAEAKEICLKYEKIEITKEMSPQEKVAAEVVNETVKSEYSDINIRKNLTDSHVVGLYKQRSNINSASEEEKAHTKNTNNFNKIYRELINKRHVANSDIARDLGRWVKDYDDKREVFPDEMAAAYTHAANIHDVTEKGAKKVEKVDEQDVTVDTVKKEEYMASVSFCTVRLKAYRDRAKEFFDDHKGLKGPYGDYVEIVKNCSSIEFMYKTGQGLFNLGRDLYKSMCKYNETYKDTFSPEEMEQMRDLASEVGAYNRMVYMLSIHGRRWDSAMGPDGQVPIREDAEATMDAMKDFESYKQEAKESVL